MAKPKLYVFSHWYHLIENFQESSQKFYASLEKAVMNRGIPGIKFLRVNFHEGGVFSAKREYLRVKRKEYVFDICAAPFGNGFFISWWLGEKPGFLMSLMLFIPVVGPLMLHWFRPVTYYKHDTTLMFQEMIHSAVLEIMDQAIDLKGIRPLTEFERKPIIHNLFKK